MIRYPVHQHDQTLRLGASQVNDLSEFEWVAVAIVSVMSAARLTRLLTVDKFPPIKFVRDWYENKTDGSNWQLLTMCGYCMGFWTALVVVGWGWLSGFNEPWWVVNAVLAVAYAGAIVMAHDGDINDDDGAV